MEEIKIQNLSLERKIKEDSTSVTYEAFDTRLEKSVAVQLFHPQYHLEDLEQSLRVKTYCRHPNVLRTYRYGVCELEHPQVFMVSDVYLGKSLAERSKKLFSPTQGLEIIDDLANALLYYHFYGVIHGALRPSNIFFKDNSSAVLGSFELFDENLCDNADSQEQMFYTAPEHSLGASEDYAKESDIFALGMICYQVLSGRHPYNISSMSNFLEDVGSEITPISEIVPYFPESLDYILFKCLAYEREERYSSVEHFLKEFRSIKSSIVNRIDSKRMMAMNINIEEECWLYNADESMSLEQYQNQYLENCQVKSENPYTSLIHGFHKTWKKDVILKVYSPKYETRRIQKDVIISERLQHENVARVHQANLYFDKSQKSYIVLDYYAKGILKETNTENWSFLQKLRLIEEIAQTLVYLHERNVIHGNLNPQNILLGDFYKPIIKSFESADTKRYHDIDDGRMGKIGQQKSFYYLDPDLFEGEWYSPAFDVYSLGIITYELLSGELPYSNNSLLMYLCDLQDREGPTALSSCANVPKTLDFLVMSAINSNRKYSITNATVYLSLLQKIIHDLGIT